MPTLKEREAIWAIQIEKYGRSPEVVDVGELSRKTENWTGAEIEGAVRKGLTLAFAEGIELEQKHVEAAIKKTVPIYELSKEKITALRDWASGRAVNASVEEESSSTRRRIQK
jgi:SpoVK/Ycf46/Vps4 family AAA+-type ATPase